MKWWAAAGLILAGCVTTPIPTYGPNGERVFYMECRFAAQCFSAAEATCHGPYRQVNTSTQTSVVGVPQPNGGTIMAPSSRTAFTFSCQ